MKKSTVPFCTMQDMGNKRRCKIRKVALVWILACACLLFAQTPKASADFPALEYTVPFDYNGYSYTDYYISEMTPDSDPAYSYMVTYYANLQSIPGYESSPFLDLFARDISSIGLGCFTGISSQSVGPSGTLCIHGDGEGFIPHFSRRYNRNTGQWEADSNYYRGYLPPDKPLQDSMRTTFPIHIANYLPSDFLGDYGLGVVQWGQVVLQPNAPPPGPPDLTSGLVAHWSFDNCDATDDSDNGHNGTIYGNPQCVDGEKGKAFSFDGTDDYIEVPNDPSLNPSAVTISAWMKVNDFPSSGSWCNNQWQLLVFKKNSLNANFEGYIISIGNGIDNIKGTVCAGTSSAAGQQVGACSTEQLQLNRWYHVAATITAEEVKIYVNGSLEDTQITGFPLDHGDRPLFFGHTGEWCEGYFNGVLDEVRIYNRALTEAEIQALYDLDITPPLPKLLFPIKGYTPYSARVTSVLDHSVFTHDPIKFYTRDSIIQAFNGETGDRKCKNISITPTYSIRGCKNESGTRFLNGVLNYTGGGEPRYLWYDGHPGYDYGITKGTTLLASANGKLFKATKDLVNSPRAANAWNKFHTFYIDHGNGYSSWYLHSNRLLPEIVAEITEKGYADVTQGQPIAKSGDYGVQGQNHLHFEVRKDGFDHANIIDPYKENLWE